MSRILIVAALAVLSCSSTAYAASNIRNVDFLNFTYHPVACYKTFSQDGLKKDVTVKRGKIRQGEVEYEIDGPIVYGHITGDQTEQAVVSAHCYYQGANYVLSETFVYSFENGHAQLLAHLDADEMNKDYQTYVPGGALWQVGLPSVLGNKIVVSGPADGPHCCPEHIVTLEYVLKGNKLALSKKPQVSSFR